MEITSSEIVAKVFLGVPVWVHLDDKNWLVEEYSVLSRDGRVELTLGATDGSERKYIMEPGTTLLGRV